MTIAGLPGNFRLVFRASVFPESRPVSSAERLSTQLAALLHADRWTRRRPRGAGHGQPTGEDSERVRLLGGEPLRLLTLTSAGGQVLAALRRGAAVSEAGTGAALLARRLVTEGFADPQPAATGQPEPDEITIAIPVRDRAVELARLLDGLARTVPTGVAVLVLDDGSRDDTAAVAAAAGATVLRHAISQGPAAARNALLAATATPFVLFLDSDCCPTPGWLEPLLAHLADPVVAAVAPRVRSLPGSGLLARYERSQSPLDLGGRPGLVRPGGRVSYVPAAALLVRRAAGIHFETALRFGEDVDLVWRLTDAGWSVRYEPASIVEHLPRAGWRGWLAQRHGYGSSAGPLALRHPGTLRPLAGGGAGAATAALLLLGRPRWALATSAISVGVLCRRLPASCGPVQSRAALAVRLSVRNQPAASLALAETIRRAWLPAAAVLVTRPAGRRILLAAALPVAVEWWLQRPPVAWPTWTAMRLLDDAAYCSGVWIGCARARTAAPLLPRL